MKTRVVDLGWAVARLELVDLDSGEKRPSLTILWPSEGEQPAGSVQLFNVDGLQNLRWLLSEGMSEWEVMQNPVDKEAASGLE